MQPRIPTLTDDKAPAPARRILDAVRRAVGMVPNLHRTLAHAPAALRGYVAAVEPDALAPPDATHSSAADPSAAWSDAKSRGGRR